MFLATHPYLLAGLVFFALWLLLLGITPRSRWKEMVGMSLVTMVLGYFVQQMHLTDWWQPTFVFSGFITIEDTLFGFSIGGVIYGVHALLCRYLRMKPVFAITFLAKVLVGLLSITSLFGLFYVLHVSSFWASIISFGIPMITTLIYDRRFYLPMLLTGLLVTAVAFCGYQFALYLNPHFVTETYLLSKLSGLLIAGIPVEELVWFFFASTGLSAFITLLQAGNKPF